MCSAERLERDLIGELRLPAGALYGIHAARAAANFPLAGRPPHPALLAALAQVKLACARTNAELGHLDPDIARAVEAACLEFLEGRLSEWIIVDALQGGAGTSTNMNVSEVLANRASQLLGGQPGQGAPVHPLDHVNRHQSTNDVVPTALRVAAITLLRRLEKAIAALQSAFQDKEREFAGVVKMGRTELQDAQPMTLGAAFSAHAEALSRDRWRVFKAEERLRVVNLGGTAVGTGLGAPRDYIFLAVEKLREVTGLGLSRAENLVDATQNADALVEVSGLLKAHAVNLFKISSDLRLLSSGPGAGLGEIRLPAMQEGSSLMPGKVNPVICEAVGQAAMQAMAQDAALTLAAQSGQLELNAFTPLMAESLLGSLTLLERACVLFRERCVLGISAQPQACAGHLRRSVATAVALVPLLGHERATEVAVLAREQGLSVREAALSLGYLDAETLDRALSAEAMTRLGQGR